jgi:SAM-dependent methyltransferase
MLGPDQATVPRKRRGGAPAVEIAHGHTIAEQGEEVWSWSTPAGQVRMAKRVELFVRSLDLASRPKKVLELGCGTGLYTERLAPFCKELVALDISDALLQQARRRVPGVRFVSQNLERVDAEQTGRAFEAVFGCSVLHHLDLDATLPRLRHLLAPGADLAFSEPNLLNPQVRLMFSRFKWARRKWATSDTEMAFYPRELRSIFEQHGFEVHELFPFDFMHPAIPAKVVPLAQSIDRFLERTPLLRFLGGSYFIHARLPVRPS